MSNDRYKAECELSKLKALSKADLILSTEVAVKFERESTVKVIRHFEEIEKRKLYLDYGFSSLFEIAVKRFGYSGAGAQRRINSMRLIRDLPEVEDKLKSGVLSLSAAANIQTYFKTKRALPLSEKLSVLTACSNKSAREVDKELATLNPQMEKKENLRFASADRLRLSLNISEELFEMLEKLKHQYRVKKVEDVIQILARNAIEPKTKSSTTLVTTAILRRPERPA